MTIRVLHVFSPGFKNRFGGQVAWWKYIFSHWNAPDVAHYILDTENDQLVDSKVAFNFEFPDKSRKTPRWERAFWVYPLFKNLTQHKKEYDILHVHTLWWGGLLIGPWARWKNIPALYESILLDEDTPGGILKEHAGKLKIRMLKKYKAILTISEYLSEDYLKFGFSKKQVFTLMNCVDIELFSPPKDNEEKMALRENYNLPKDATILLFVGAVNQRKGVDVLIRAFIAVCSKKSDPLYLVIIGPNNKHTDFINELTWQLESNSLSNRVAFTGIVKDKQLLAEMYRAADIFVFPSNKEGLGNVVLEAMASGLPVVVSQLPVLEKFINHGENGLFIPMGDIDALKNAVLTLSNTQSLRIKLSANARKYIQKNHSYSDWQNQIVELYKKLEICEEKIEHHD